MMNLWTVVFGILFLCSISGFDPCTNHTTIHEPLRSVTNVPSKIFLCDRLLKPGWARFQDAEMPFNTCIKPYHCGTHIPIWLKGDIPLASAGIVEVTACADMTPGNGNCCEYTYPMRIKNCGRFMVYDLLSTVGCSIAYCAGSMTICSGDKYSPTGFEPCSDAYPKLSGNPVLGVPEIFPGDFRFTCHIPYPAQQQDADFSITWLTDGKPIAGLQPVHIHNSSTRNAVITGDQLYGQMGKSLSCSVKSSYSDNHTGIVSPAWTSNNYWIGVKYKQDSLHLEPTGDEETLQLMSTVPVVCRGPGGCSVDFYVQTNNDGIMLNDCTIELKPTDWNSVTHTATTTATLKSTAGTHTLNTQLTTAPGTNNSGNIWNNFHVSPVQVAITPSSGAICSLWGDPHIRTFDNHKTYMMLVTGQFTAVKTKSPKELFQVDIRTWKCGRAVCTCGVVAREGNDVVGVDLCHGKYGRSYPKFLKDKTLFSNRTIVQHDASGRHFVFKFPSSAYVKVQASRYSTYMNVYIHVPGIYRRHTEGLCGFFDNNEDNDLTDKTGKIGRPDEFSKSWKIPKGESLFEKVEPVPTHMGNSRTICNCTQGYRQNRCPKQSPPDPPIQVLCPNCKTVSSVDQSPVGTGTTHTLQPTSTVARSTSQPTTSGGFLTTSSVSSSASNLTTVLPTTPVWTGLVHYLFTYSTITRPNPSVAPFIPTTNASVFCESVIRSYKPAKECIQNHYHINVADIKDMCVEDLTLTGDTEMAVSALSSLVEECAMQLLTNNTYHNLDLIKVCPGACSGNGQCLDGVCTCNTGFSGSDCSIDMKSPPILKEIVGGNICDIQGEECHFPTLVGENISPENTTCVLRPLKFSDRYVSMSLATQAVKSSFGSTNHVNCPLPYTSPLPALSGYSIKLKNKEKESGEQFFTIYSSKCMNCTSYQNCVQKENTCLIENQCYLAGESEGYGTYCDPTRNSKSWSSYITTGKPKSADSSVSPNVINLQSAFPPITDIPVTLPVSVTPGPLLSQTPLPIAPLGGRKTTREDIWTKPDLRCPCGMDPSRTNCACCEAGGEQCPDGDMCVRAGDLQSCGTKKTSDAHGEDYWTATYSGCGCLFDFARTDCACCQNQGCPCSAANRNQCVDCLHSDRCGQKRWVFGPDFANS